MTLGFPNSLLIDHVGDVLARHLLGLPSDEKRVESNPIVLPQCDVLDGITQIKKESVN